MEPSPPLFCVIISQGGRVFYVKTLRKKEETKNLLAITGVALMHF
jgi:hypothetical protein